MADIELVEEEEAGIPYDIIIYDKNNLDSKGRPQLVNFTDLGVTTAKLFIAKEESMATPVLDNKALAIVGEYTVRWTIANGDIPTADDYFAIIKLTGATTPIIFTNLLTVHVQPRLGTL